MSAEQRHWLRFSVGEAPYAIPLHVVAEVTSAAPLRLIPLVPIHVGGIVNVRGEPLAVLDGGVLLRHQSAGRYRHIIVLEKDSVRIGMRVGQVEGLGRVAETRSELDADAVSEGHVRWVTAEGEKLGVIEPDALLERARELLTGRRSKIGEESCPNVF